MSVLDGPHRLEMSKTFQRPFRMGTPAALRTGDLEFVESSIRAGNAGEAAQFLDYVHASSRFLLLVAYEWALRWPDWVARNAGAAQERAISAEAYTIWARTIEKLPRLRDSQAFVTLSKLYSTAQLNPNSIHVFMEALKSGGRGDLGILDEQAVDSLKKVQQPFARKEIDSALSAFKDYSDLLRAQHDLIFRFVWAYGTAVNQALGQPRAEEALRATLQESSTYSAPLSFARDLSPRDLAAVLAEHLRAHFSGSGRSGSVEIVEEPDRYRLVLDACGSGGAMRRENAEHGITGYGVFAAPSHSTWNQPNVPIYCAHCAQNEAATARVAGRPAWITEFRSDEKQPCQWVVFKDRTKTPVEYLRRIGLV
jgi:hypothetical protein